VAKLNLRGGDTAPDPPVLGRQLVDDDGDVRCVDTQASEPLHDGLVYRALCLERAAGKHAHFHEQVVLAPAGDHMEDLRLVLDIPDLPIPLRNLESLTLRE